MKPIDILAEKLRKFKNKHLRQPTPEEIKQYRPEPLIVVKIPSPKIQRRNRMLTRSMEMKCSKYDSFDSLDVEKFSYEC